LDRGVFSKDLKPSKFCEQVEEWDYYHQIPMSCKSEEELKKIDNNLLTEEEIRQTEEYYGTIYKPVPEIEFLD
jgi:FMN phosphatase YigB (HAD superfamily)